MEKQDNNESAADADGYADTLTDNSYASSSGSDSDESNTSLLEKNSILSDKFMLPKDFCESAAIFSEFFCTSLWDTLSPSVRQHLTKFLPIVNDERHMTTKVVHDLFSHQLDRFGVDPMAVFQHNLAEGNFRADIAKLRCNLGKSMRKERRMLELQRMARLAQKLMISRETTLLAELQTNGDSSMAPIFHPRYVQTGLQNRWTLQLNGTRGMEKCRVQAKKRYLSEIVSVSEAAGIPLSVSDEEDCLDVIPSGPSRKQRRMFGMGPHASSDQQLHALQRHGTVQGYTSILGSKRGTLQGNHGGVAANVFDGASFGTPKLFVVTEEHYQRLLLQYRKRKYEEPDHPEMLLNGVKLKDVVTRTQLAAGYRRILPLPKVYLPEANIDSTLEGNEKTSRPAKSFKARRTSSDKEDLKKDVLLDKSTTKAIVAAKVEPLDDHNDGDGNIVPKLEATPCTSFELQQQLGAQSDVKPLTSLLCKQEVSDTPLAPVTTAQDQTGVSFVDESIESSTNQLILPSLPASAIEGSSVGAVPVDMLLGNDTHACFLSLVRDIFCSNPDHRLTIEELQLRLDAWSKCSVASRNTWYSEYHTTAGWNETLQSAVQFLTGEFKHQPEDFVPYIEHKVALNILQWIGASRDGDSRLVPLCAYWQSRKHEMGLASSALLAQTVSSTAASHAHIVTSVATNCNPLGNAPGATSTAYPAKAKNKHSVSTKLLLLSSNSSSSSSSSLSSISSMTTIGDGNSILADVPTTSMSLGAMCSSQDDDGSVSERSVSPPPPRFPTDWAVRKATDEEVYSFRQQEKRRYENPHMAFTYKQHSYNSVVGPVKGIYTQVPGISKARGHSMLVADRPNFVTILTLVRDATARLPNGEGTRADICELLKSSQYISPTATDQILQTIVSGALDRMHTEHDPCVKYDAKRKTWIYLHRNRTEEEFERLHLQYQGFTKHKKVITRKPLRCHKESVTSPSRMTSEHDSSDFSSSASTNKSDASKTSSVGPNSASVAPSPVMSYAIKPAKSLLKKQPSPVQSHTALVVGSERKAPDAIPPGAISIKKAPTGAQHEQLQHPQQPQQQPSLLVASETSTEQSTGLKISPKACGGGSSGGAVTIITSTGNSVKTIKIQKSSLSLASKQANVFGLTSSSVHASSEPVVGRVVQTENVVPSYITLPQKNVLVSAIRPTPDTKELSPTATAANTTAVPTKLLTDILRKVPTMPITIQSSTATAVPLHSSSSPLVVTSSMESDKKIQPGSSMLSIRQVTSTASGLMAGSETSAPPAAVNEQATSVVAPSSMLLQTKSLQLPPNSGTTVVSSTAGSATIIHPAVRVSTTMVSVVAPSAKPIFTSSTGSSHIKSLPASSATILSNTSTLPQRVVVSTAGGGYTPINSVGPAGITVKASGIVSGLVSGSSVIPNSSTQRLVRPSANLISTITLAKGQQSVLTQAQQKQILQNLLCQQQKQQQVLTAKKIVPTMLTTSGATVTSTDSSGEAVRGTEIAASQATTVSLLQTDNQKSAGTVSTYKLQHHQHQHANANQTIKALSPQIVKITPARTATAQTVDSLVGVAGNAANCSTPTMVASMSPVSAQVPAGVKMMKVQQSNIVASSTGASHAILPAGTIASGKMVAVSGAPGTTATMRVLKTATGTTTVIKTGVHGTAANPATLLPQTGAMHHATLAKLRKDGSGPIVSKVTVTPNVSTGQMIPLESLLQKQGIANTTTGQSVPGGAAFLKIATPGKAGQPQFLQFSTNTTNSATGGGTTHHTVTPISSASGAAGHQQYTVVAQNARNIISVTPSTATAGATMAVTGSTTGGRSTSMPVTIVSSIASESANDGSKLASTTSHVLSSVGTAPAGSTILTHAAAGKLQHANKLKLFASASGVTVPSVATVNSGSQQQQPKTPMAATVLTGGSGGEFLANAKIIGVRNVSGGKIKSGSSLSIMNAANLNIAHIGGKPIIIANSSALSGSPSATVVSTANIGNLGSNQTNSSVGTGSSSTMLLTSNTAYGNVLQGKNVITTSSGAAGDGNVAGTTVSNQPGHMQTLMLGNQMVRVQTIQAAAAGKLAHQMRQTLVSDGGGTSAPTPREAGAGTNALLTTAAGCTVVQQQQTQQQAVLCSSGSAINAAPGLPKSIQVSSALGAGALSKSIVKIHPSSTSTVASGHSPATAKVIEMGQPKTQAQQGQRVVLATSSGQLLTQPLILPSGFQSSGPINIKRLKVIPVSKQCKK